MVVDHVTQTDRHSIRFPSIASVSKEQGYTHTVYPKKYAHGFVVLCFVVVMQSFIMNSHEVFIHIHQGCFAGTGAIVRLPQCQWSKLDGYGKISQCITTTKHSKAKTVCIFLGIYCTSWNAMHAKGHIFLLELLIDTSCYLVGINRACCPAVFTGATVLLCHVIKFLQLIWRSATRSTNELQWLNLKIGHQRSSSSNDHPGDWHYPLYSLSVKRIVVDPLFLLSKKYQHDVISLSAKTINL